MCKVHLVARYIKCNKNTICYIFTYIFIFSIYIFSIFSISAVIKKIYFLKRHTLNNFKVAGNLNYAIFNFLDKSFEPFPRKVTLLLEK